MSDKPLPFVITDRRRHTSEGESRPDADPREPKAEAQPASPAPTPIAAVHEPRNEDLSSVAETGGPASASSTPAEDVTDPDPELPPAPTSEQMEQSRVAFEATAERLDTAIRAANPGAEHPPVLTFESIIQSVYMQAVMQLGGGTPEGQQPQIDILGARQSIDMLSILNQKTQSNISDNEAALLSSALFELRIAFLEVTQALARSAQQRAAAAPQPPGMPPSGPRIVR